MALKTIVRGNSSNNFIRMGDLAEGQSVAGYLLGTTQGKYKESFLIKLLSKEGDVLTLTANGNLNKLEELLGSGDLTANVFTEFTKTGSYTSKQQVDPKTKEFREVPVFDIAQDSDDLVSDDDAARALSEDEAARADAAAEAAPAPAAKPAPRQVTTRTTGTRR